MYGLIEFKDFKLLKNTQYSNNKYFYKQSRNTRDFSRGMDSDKKT